MDKIQLLPVTLLKDYATIVNEFKTISTDLNIGLGWHYLLDLSWVAQQVNPIDGMKILDAGAGMGIMQWWLAEKGVDVISVDRQIREYMPFRYRRRYKINGIRQEDYRSKIIMSDFLPSKPFNNFVEYSGRVSYLFKKTFFEKTIDYANGRISIYNQDLKNLKDIPDKSIDAVISISALEHNPSDELKSCIDELMRVLKPNGKMIVTMAASNEQDWYHNPSKGWCYSEKSFHELFDLSPDCQSNFEKYDEIFEELKKCIELRDNLADFYFKSENNGMPWGIWDPKYQPVGIVKIKE